MMMNSGPCIDLHHQARITKCLCMEDLRDEITEEEKDEVVEYLIGYAKLGRQEQRSVIGEWKRHAEANVFLIDGTERRSAKHKVFLLPGSTTHKICKNSIAKLVGKSKDAWKSIGLKDVHGLANRRSNHALKTADMELLHDYFFSLNALAAPRATKLVTGLSADGRHVSVELKDADADLVELPSCHSKRSLYHSYLAEVGWKCTYDNKSRMTSMVLLEESTKKTDTPVSWPSFCRFWKQNFPKLVIQSPSEDICDDCVVYANRHKYLRKKRFDLREDAEDNTDQVDTNVQDCNLEEQEDLVVKAAHHVMMARRQRELFNFKKQKARDTVGCEREQRTYTYVADFAQNMYLPNFAAEQPGATYYYSPLNVYPFGVVDCSMDPSQLTAHMFYEGTALFFVE